MRTFTTEELKNIIANHKLWLESDGEQGARADLRYANLSSANLRSADLRSADLSYADLRSANLRYADLSYADLRSADLRYADLRSANLSSANLRSADLSYADLRYADLRSANLSSANLRYADLRYANLSYANLDYSAFPLWCGGLDVHIDDRLAIQMLYHLERNVIYSKNTSKALKKIFCLKSIVKKANEFHRVKECGEIKPSGDKSDEVQ